MQLSLKLHLDINVERRETPLVGNCARDFVRPAAAFPDHNAQEICKADLSRFRVLRDALQNLDDE